VERPVFTWWGGILGPKLLNHAVCKACRLGFNAKTRRPKNDRAILAYFGVAAGIAVVLGVLLAALGLIAVLR
jgi:hypothetical protein